MVLLSIRSGCGEREDVLWCESTCAREDEVAEDVYAKFLPADVKAAQNRPELDMWVERLQHAGRMLLQGDIDFGEGGGGDLTAAALLALLKTVDGAGSGLDADVIRGVDPSYFASADALAAEIARAVAAEQALAPIISPAFQGVPTGPTAEPGTNNEQLATTAFVLANGGGGGGSLPVLTPEQYGITTNEPDENASLVVSALNTMFLEAVNRGGAICWLRGNYPINEPIFVPANVSLIGVSRGEGTTGPSTIRGVVGNHDLIKFAYGVENVHISGMNFCHSLDVVPTAGVMIDARWMANFFWQNISGFNLYNGIDFGVARSGILQDCYLRGFVGQTSGMGTDGPATANWGFGILVRSTQTLLDGNVGKETQFYDRDGSGVTVQPKSKGTSVKFRGIFINGKQVGEDDGDSEEQSLAEEYSPNFVCFWSYGASTIRCESMQLRQGENALRLQHAPNREGVNRDGAETGKQMCAGNFFFNCSAEANKRTYDIGGYEKLYMILCQCNGVSTNGWDLGDNPDGTYPGVPSGNAPVDLYGGTGTFLLCNALTCQREGFVIWSGKNRIIEPMVAGFSGAREGDIDPGTGVSFTATTTSSNYAFNTGASGTNSMVIENTGATTMYFAIGNSSVVATTGGTPVAAGGYTIFSRTSQTHIAVITASGTTTGKAGKVATLNSNGILIKGGAENGLWIHGGVVSANKALKDNTNQSNIGFGIQINSGANKVFIDGVYVMDGGIDNDASMTEGQITNLTGRAAGYRYTTSPQTTINTITSTSYTPAMRDNGNTIALNNSAGGTLLIPNNSSVPFPIGATFKIININGAANTWNVNAASGVTVVANNFTASSGQGGEFVKTATNTWVYVK